MKINKYHFISKKKELTKEDYESIRENGYTATFLISNAEVDRQGDTIDVKGWTFENFMKNPVIQVEHEPEVTAFAKSIYESDDALFADIYFPPAYVSEKSNEIARKVAFGSYSAVSVGFDPIDYDIASKRLDSWDNPLDFKKQDLLEISIVAVPANPHATIVQKSLAKEKLLTKHIKAEVKQMEVQEEVEKELVGSDPSLIEILDLVKQIHEDSAKIKEEIASIFSLYEELKAQQEVEEEEIEEEEEVLEEVEEEINGDLDFDGLTEQEQEEVLAMAEKLLGDENE